MKPLAKIYWLRLALGAVAALASTGYAIATGRIPQVSQGQPFPGDTSLLLNSMALAIIIYMISYYVIKYKFATQVEKPQKLVTMGIGIYFIAWIVLWVFLYTILAGPPIQPI